MCEKNNEISIIAISTVVKLIFDQQHDYKSWIGDFFFLLLFDASANTIVQNSIDRITRIIVSIVFNVIGKNIKLTYGFVIIQVFKWITYNIIDVYPQSKWIGAHCASSHHM